MELAEAPDRLATFGTPWYCTLGYICWLFISNVSNYKLKRKVSALKDSSPPPYMLSK